MYYLDKKTDLEITDYADLEDRLVQDAGYYTRLCKTDIRKKRRAYKEGYALYIKYRGWYTKVQEVSGCFKEGQKYGTDFACGGGL